MSDRDAADTSRTELVAGQTGTPMPAIESDRGGKQGKEEDEELNRQQRG